ncbi:hypothetical protein LUZ60_003881 [Juncus effusus]|nr:hypothetical protein LUZ60_003881 [Juncus effusus]
MGKPKGDAARSKNRPSSSSMAASLLPAGVSSVGFGGYLGASKIETSVPSSSSVSPEESLPFSDIDSEVAQHIKRLGRKDPTTKLKALAYLCQLFKEKSGEEIVHIVPLWAFEYKRLLHDYNREVRRSTHETMTALVTSIKRGLAPHLKTLMGPWWFSQFDPTHEVSQAARSSFEAAFPQSERRLDALMLCGKEIFLYLDENLNLTIQSLSDKSTPQDELEDMHQRIISSSLLAIATLIDVILGIKLHKNPNNNENNLKIKLTIISSAETLFSTHKYFLNFLKSKIPTIRSATYSLLTSYMNQIPQLFNESNIKTISQQILSSFQDKDPICHSSMWEMIITFSKKFPEGWSKVSEKSVLSQLCSFLRNGSYGSQNVSFPVLVPFLDCVPVKYVDLERFILEFFKSFWAGRNPARSAIQENILFFDAFKECFLSVLHNSERYSSDSCYKITDEILIKLLLHNYLFLDNDSNKSEDQMVKYSSNYLKQLGKCLIEISSELYNLSDQGLFDLFCSSFKRDCMDIIQKCDNSNKYHEQIEQISNFFILMNDFDLIKSQSWPLDSFARPLVKDSFPVIKSLDNAGLVKLLFVLVNIFKPESLFTEPFLQTFKDDFTPWCLSGITNNTLTIKAKLDLIIGLMKEELFSEQWASILSHLTESQSQSQSSDEFDRFKILAILLDKIRGKIGNLRNENWSHELLDSAAIEVAINSSAKSSYSHFLCAVIGGSSKDDQTCFLSKQALKTVLDKFLQKLAFPLAESNFGWTRFSYTNLIPSHNTDYSYQNALSAFEVIKNSIYSIVSFNDAPVSSILAALFCLAWESKYITHEEEYNIDNDDNNLSELKLGEMAHDFIKNLGTEFWADVDRRVRADVASSLVRVIRFAVFEEGNCEIFCDFVMDLVSFLCQNETQIQAVLDQLLSEENSLATWPIWTQLNNQTTRDINNNKQLNMIAFVDKLISRLGFNKVISCGEITKIPSRDWLAAEILCAWKWETGSAQTSFLPSLIEYAKSNSSEMTVLPSIAKILLNGAVLDGSGFDKTSWIFFNSWGPSDNEIDGVQEPFLRALISVLVVLGEKCNLQRKNDAFVVFESVMSLINDLKLKCESNKGWLRVLPFVMSNIIQPLCENFDEGNNNEGVVYDNVLGWLNTCISCFNDPSSKEEFEDWIQIALSCYPLNIIEGNGIFRVKTGRAVKSEEKSQLINLFRKFQRSEIGFISSNLMQITESKLNLITAVYCWPDLEENDWRVIFNRLNKWIESFVLLMEETTENIETAVQNSNFETLKSTIQNLDKSVIETTNVALITLSFISNQEEIKEKLQEETKERITGNILRIFLTSGATESIASSLNQQASLLISENRHLNSRFWSVVASFVINSTSEARKSAVESMDLWGLSKDSVNALYAILFSNKPVDCMQLASFELLKSEPVCGVSVVKETVEDPDLDSNLNLNLNLNLRDEISELVQIPPDDLLETDLLSQDRINVFIAWALLLTHLQSLQTTSPKRQKIIQFIQDNTNPDILSLLFQHIPLINPNSPTPKSKDSASALSPEALNAAKASQLSILNSSLSIYIESLWPMGSGQVAALAGALYGTMVHLLPSFVRNWYGGLRDRAWSIAVEGFTKTWCSPPLLSDELSQVKESVSTDENFSITVSKSVNEIVATYKKEESGMDLVIRLPASYPLRHADVECTRSLGISEVKQRKWLLSLTAFIRNQNGAIAEAIEIWKKNFDKEFEGVEECPICYSIIHTANHSLPRLACKTCKHKFHSACLYKWFSTSHKSTCPLCQTPF